METSGHLREKAELCRRLATSITTRNHPTAAALHALAAEFDAAAAVIDASSAAAQAMGYGDDRAEKGIAPDGYRSLAL